MQEGLDRVLSPQHQEVSLKAVTRHPWRGRGFVFRSRLPGHQQSRAHCQTVHLMADVKQTSLTPEEISKGCETNTGQQMGSSLHTLKWNLVLQSTTAMQAWLCMQNTLDIGAHNRWVIGAQCVPGTLTRWKHAYLEGSAVGNLWSTMCHCHLSPAGLSRGQALQNLPTARPDKK